MRHSARMAGLLAVAVPLVSAGTAQTAELVVQTGHQHEVRSVAFSPDGSQVITAGVGNGCNLWDTRTGQEIRTLADPRDAETASNVEAVFFHPDGRRVFTLSGGTITTWDAATGKLLNKFGNYYQQFETVALSPDGSRFAVVHMSGATMAVIDSTSGAEILPLEHESHFAWERVDHLAFSPDGGIVAGTGPDNFIRLWNTATGKQFEPIKDPSHYTPTMAFSPDGTLLAGGGSERVTIWNIGSRQIVGTITTSVQAIVFSPDGTDLIGGDGTGILHKWDFKTGLETARIDAHAETIKSGINQVTVDGRTSLVATAGDDGSAKLWDLNTLRSVNTLAGVTSPTGYVGISPNGRDLVTATWDGAVRLWTLDDREMVRTVVKVGGGVFDFSPDAQLIATFENGITLRDTTTLEAVKKFNDSDVVNGASFTADGRRLVSHDEKSQIKLWNIRDGAVIETLFAQSTMEGAMGDNIAHLSYSPDGKSFVTITNNGKLAIWDAATKTRILPLEGRVNATWIKFSPDGREIVAGAYQKVELWFWNAATGMRIVHRDVPGWLQINAGRYAVGIFGGLLIRAETDGAKVRLLDANSGKELATLVGLNHDEWVVTTPDGRFDTNKPLDNIRGLAWVLSDDPMTPRPLDLFIRQYYEPGLLQRLLACTKSGTCQEEFRVVPSVAKVNRVQSMLKVSATGGRMP